MEGGAAGGYEEPSKLLDTNSYFSKLVAESWSSGKIENLMPKMSPITNPSKEKETDLNHY
ncbi:unnamed protein product [Prunus armeniaca]|uniref:Uncharacterized protein n=1 Tax=Prunus armeniaca TaxID=36596 RepID=A0A6J5WMM2_PRUAR|nr:unnamed protein product [Prunus armeniaca]